jgi:penicillin amidase
MRLSAVLPACALLTASVAFAGANPPGRVKDETISLPGLEGPARILRDVDGMSHIYAFSERDAVFLQGWVTAQDRLFQIDVLRRTASGTLAELLGQGALGNDVQLRTLGLRRASERSLAAYSKPMLEGLQAYADGVNAWVARNPLPAEYGLLEITRFEPWTALDSAVIGKALAFQLSFDLDIDATLNFLAYQRELGKLDPTGQLAFGVFFGDAFRAAPFDPAASVPDAIGAPWVPGVTPAGMPQGGKGSSRKGGVAGGAAPGMKGPKVDQATRKLLERYREDIKGNPFIERALSRTERQIGSNEWAVSGRHTVDGRPLVANDPHLSLDLPPNFHPVHLVSKRDGLDAIGSAVAGAPWVVLGQNRHVTWGETTTGFDVTDTYQERIQALPDGRLFTIYQGQLEPIEVLPARYRVNVIGDGQPDNLAVVPGTPPILIVPRRNHGPILDLDIDPATGQGTAISVQWAGNGPTRELETFRLFNRAKNVQDFVAALQYFDVGSQNFIYGDIEGNIGYFTSGEVPLREDLQALRLNGAPPWFIRDGQGGNEWIRKDDPGATDGTGYEYLPFAELPQTINPANGWVVNANNDPAGVTLDNDPLNQIRVGPGGAPNGLYYLGYAFDFGTRAGRITQALQARLAAGPVDRDDMKAIQADVKLLDGEVLAPYIVQAFGNATAPGAPAGLLQLAGIPGVAEAVGRLSRWDYTAPTGVLEGYDAADVDGERLMPTRAEIESSIAATIYSVWRAKMIGNGLDLTLGGLNVPTPGSGEAIKAIRHLLERDGIGLSTIDFFGWAPGATAAERRDFVVLKSLADALTALAGNDFAPAFANSTDQDDYRWGKLHRITFDAVLGGPFSIPGATPGFDPAFPGLPGLAVDGGFGVVDASSHGARAASFNAFRYGSGPNRRYVGTPGTVPGSIEAESALPGGASGVLGDPFYANLLGRYLTNDTYPLRTNLGEVMRNLSSQQEFKPAR